MWSLSNSERRMKKKTEETSTYMSKESLHLIASNCFKDKTHFKKCSKMTTSTFKSPWASSTRNLNSTHRSKVLKDKARGTIRSAVALWTTTATCKCTHTSRSKGHKETAYHRKEELQSNSRIWKSKSSVQIPCILIACSIHSQWSSSKLSRAI